MNRLLDILIELHDDIDYETCTNLIDGKLLDSFDIITLIAEIAEEFDVVITAEHMTPENFNSAQALFELIEELESE